MFSSLFRGKVPLIIYGSCEITPFVSDAAAQMAMSPYPTNAEAALSWAERGATNCHDNKPAFGHYIGNARTKALKLRVVRSVARTSPQFLVGRAHAQAPCDEGEPGFIVCDLPDRSRIVFDRDPAELFHGDTYLGLADVGFHYRAHDGHDHLYWMYNANASFARDPTYPFAALVLTSKRIQDSIVIRNELNTSIVRVETVRVATAEAQSKVVALVEIIGVIKSDLHEKIRTEYFKNWSRCGRRAESAGLFHDCIAPDEVKVISIPWTYKGSINYAALKVGGHTAQDIVAK